MFGTIRFKVERLNNLTSILLQWIKNEYSHTLRAQLVFGRLCGFFCFSVCNEIFLDWAPIIFG